jgi:hypothetical protein
MLPAFCFDHSGKMKYISLALEEYYGDAPPRFARKIRDHEPYINRLKRIVFGAAEVRERLSKIVNDDDLRRYIL